MVKHLRFSKILMVERTGALMLVSYLDDEGNMYDWAPKWADVETIFLKQINVERFNKPDSAWLNKFAKTAQNVVEGAQKIKSAQKVRGTFDVYENEQIVLAGKGRFTPAFDVTVNFLDSWLGSFIEVLCLNDMAIRLRQYDEWGDKVLKEYPEQRPEDPPF